GDGQAEPASCARLVLDLPEAIEEVRYGVFGDASPGVLDLEAEAVVPLRGPDRNPAPARRELDRVVQKVGEHPSKLVAVGHKRMHERLGRDVEVDASFFGKRGESVGCLLDELLDLELVGLDHEAALL